MNKSAIRTIFLIGHGPGHPSQGKRKDRDLIAAEYQELTRLYGTEGTAFRFITKNPADAEALHKLRTRAKTLLVLAPRRDFQFDFEPLQTAAGEKEWLAPLKCFQYPDLVLTLTDYVHKRRAAKLAA